MSFPDKTNLQLHDLSWVGTCIHPWRSVSMPGMDTSNACGSRSAPLPAFLSTSRALKLWRKYLCKVTGLGVKAPYDEDNEVLARQMHGGVELMGLDRSLLLGTGQGLVPTWRAPCPVEEEGGFWG